MKYLLILRTPGRISDLASLSLFHIIALQSNLNLFVDDYNDVGDGCREQHLNMQQLLNKQSCQHRFNTSFSRTDQIGG